MILRKTYVLLIGLFLIFITNSCGQESNQSTREDPFNFIELAQANPIEIFDEWNIWKRSDGYIYDYIDLNYRFLIIIDNKEKYLFKEIFPLQDSTFHSLDEIESRSGQYPFKVTNFSDKIILFRKLNIDYVKSITEDSLIMFIDEGFNVIYSQRGFDITRTIRFKGYTKYDNFWYFFLKD